jgi:hypothetical protein
MHQRNPRPVGRDGTDERLNRPSRRQTEQDLSWEELETFGLQAQALLDKAGDLRVQGLGCRD